ncbi:MAG: type ISP restriction/modification enzyme [Bryobacteraceae bacterium]
MHPVESYLAKLAEIRASGHATDETSFYPAIEGLFSEIGNRLKPRVRPIFQLKNRGAGLPDGGLFSQDQLKKNAMPEDFTVQPPNRGVLEVKGLSEDTSETMQSGQVKKYLRAYGQVLLTNYREFRVVVLGKDDKPRTLETFTLAKSEAAFWALAAHPRKAEGEVGKTLEEFLTRALLSAVPITSPDVLASFLASYAREALAKIEPRSSLKELEDVREALEEALGLKFGGALATETENRKGQHFFRSTLVQTLFYGLFSAWVLWSREPGRRRDDQFEWRSAVWSLQVPMIRALFERLVTPSHVRSLGLEELLFLTGEVLNRVDAAAFIQRFEFEEGAAVQYFYEPFLEAFDPELRKQLGVWYTPREIVRYMVERVDTVLRTELGLPSGLADPNVYVLDPACGTGAYLVEVLDRIHRTLKEERGEDALTPHQLKEAAKQRVFGFEILPAPYVIAHLQIGMYLRRANAPLTDEQSGKRERAGVYLTNALTGWEPPDKQKARLPFREFQEEREEADTVKRDKPILVVLGNPPYNAFAGVSPSEEDGLVDPYKEGLIKEWGIKKFNLDDLYVRFFRLAERRIAEKSRRGVVCFISNFSYLSEPSYVVMRKRLLQGFDSLWFDCLNGDSRETGKLTPAGKPDPSVFSTKSNGEGIRVGTAVGLLIRRGKRKRGSSVHYRELWGTRKREELVESLQDTALEGRYADAAPTPANRYSFQPQLVSAAYSEWPKTTELCAEPPSNGLMEKRGGALIDFDRERLVERMRLYHDKGLDWEAYRLVSTALAGAWAGFDARKARKRALDAGFHSEQIVRYAVRPFDTRWCYFTDIPAVWNRSRPALWARCFGGNRFIATRPAGVADPEGFPFMFTAALGDNDALRGHAYYFPLDLRQSRPVTANGHLFEAESPALPNYSPTVREYLEAIGLDRAKTAGPSLWLHVLAIGYSPAYLRENADGVRQGWPRIPLPSSLEQFKESAALGQRVADLLDTEKPVAAVTVGALRPELRSVAGLRRVGGKPLDAAEDMQITAGWGHAGKAGVTMPGRGKLVSRERTTKELSELTKGLAALGISRHEGLARLGSTVMDVYLNDLCAWTNVPEKAWEFYIGGYQVMKKWLSYREHDLLKRPLTLAEAEEVQAMARRLTALCLLQPELDANYLKVKSATWEGPSAPEPA